MIVLLKLSLWGREEIIQSMIPEGAKTSHRANVTLEALVFGTLYSTSFEAFPESL